MNSKQKLYLRRRQWLRPVNSWGPESSIHTVVELDEYTTNEPPHTSRSLNGSVGVRDCYRMVRLEYDASNEKHYNKHLKAMDKLLSEIQMVRAAWIKGHDDILERGGWSHVHSKT